MRYITINSKSIPLKIYIAGIRKAKDNPDVVFSHGLTTWWPVKGSEVMQQFRKSVQDRINQGIPYIDRGRQVR